MSDEIPPPPPQPKTVTFAAADKNEILLAELKVLMVAGFKEQSEKTDCVVTNLALVSNDLSLVKDRVGLIEVWRADVDSRANRTSARVREVSSVDLVHDAKLAQDRAAIEGLTGKVDDLTKSQDVQLAILARLDKVASNPTVKAILFALGTIATGYLASKGLK